MVRAVIRENRAAEIHCAQWMDLMIKQVTMEEARRTVKAALADYSLSDAVLKENQRDTSLQLRFRLLNTF